MWPPPSPWEPLNNVADISKYVSSLSGVSWSGRDSSPGMAMLANNSCQPAASRYGMMPVILLTVIYNRSSAEAKWFIQKVAGTLVRPCRKQSLSVLIVRSTCPLALLLPTVIVVMDSTKPFARLCKAARKLCAIVGPDIAQLAQWATRSLYRNSAALRLCSEGTVQTSTYLENGCTVMRR